MVKVVGFSGGQDSCALAHWLKNNQKAEVLLVHYDHGWEQDAGLVAKCEELANYLELPLKVIKGASSNSETTARKARYKAISEVYREIYIAHTETDMVETGLYNLCRNPSIKGITSLSHPSRYLEDYNLWVHRPLLNWTREQTQLYCVDNGIDYHSDAYNHNEEVSKRVIIRNKIIPELERVNKQAEKHISNFIQDMKKTDMFIERYVNKAWETIYVDNTLDLVLLLEEDILIQERIWLKYLSVLNIRLRRNTINYLVNWSSNNKSLNNKSNNLQGNKYLVIKQGKIGLINN
jgi:tRNA(Ile)-lysidine synthase